MVHLSDPCGSCASTAQGGDGSPRETAALHTHAMPTPPPSPRLSRAASLSRAESWNDPPDLPLLPLLAAPVPLARPATQTTRVRRRSRSRSRPHRPTPPTVVQLVSTLSALPPDSWTSRRHLLHVATTTGRTLRAAVVSWDDPVGGVLVCAGWLTLCALARPLLVLGPHALALGVLVGNYPGPRPAQPRKEQPSVARAPRGGVTHAAAAAAGAAGAWSTTLADLASVSRAVRQGRAWAAAPGQLAVWTDPERSFAALWVVLVSFPYWIALHWTLPTGVAVGVAGLVGPIGFGLVPRVLSRLPPPLADPRGASVPGMWRGEPRWVAFGVCVHVVRWRVWRLGQGYGALLEAEEASVRGKVGYRWRDRHAVRLPGDELEVEGVARLVADVQVARQIVSGIQACRGVQWPRVKWEWETRSLGEGEEEQGDAWEPVGEWERVEVPGQGVLGRIMAGVEQRRYVRHAVCWVPVEEEEVHV